MEKNLIESLQYQIKRNEELAEIYDSIGPAGLFGKAMIEKDIILARESIATMDTVQMVRSLSALRGNK